MNWECLIVGLAGCIIGAVVIAIVTCVISSRETEQEKQCYRKEEVHMLSQEEFDNLQSYLKKEENNGNEI